MRLYVLLRQPCARLFVRLEVRLLTLPVAVPHAMALDALLEGVRGRGAVRAGW
jgi:hypothetical protein